MYSLIFPLIIIVGAGAWLLVQGIKYSNLKRVILGVVLMAMPVAVVGLVTWRGDIVWFDALEQQTQYGLQIAIQLGMVIAKACGAIALLLIFIWAMDNRFIRRFTILAIAIVGSWWWVKNWSEFLVVINRVATDIADTLFG